MAEITNDIERYNKLLQRDPDSRVFAPLAEAYRKANRLPEALETARAGVERHPAYASGRVALARAQLSLEQYKEAAGELAQAVAYAPENALAHRLLGEARRGLGDRDAAFEAFARALALNPEDEEARQAIAILEKQAPDNEASAPLTKPLEGEGPDAPAAAVDVPPQHLLDGLDIAQSSLAPEARDSIPKEAGTTESSFEAVQAEETPAPEFEKRSGALPNGNPERQGATRDLTDLAPETEAPVEAPPAGDRIVRRKVEENIETLNRWLANIRKGAAR